MIDHAMNSQRIFVPTPAISEIGSHHLSIVVPVYNEVENVVPLLTKIDDAFKAYPLPWELIVVDDNSPAFGLSREVSTVQQAIPVLGSRVLSSLVAGFALRSRSTGRCGWIVSGTAASGSHNWRRA